MTTATNTIRKPASALEGRRVIVTGGNRGIGLAVARSARAAGATTAILGRDQETLRAAGSELFAPWASADVSVRAQLEPALDRLHAELGGLDAIVCCAGFTERLSAGDDLEAAEGVWDRVLAADLKGSFLSAQWAAPRLARPGGRIVCISSIAAYTGGSTGGAVAYGAAKAGVLGLVRALARELAPEGISVNAIVPGLVAGTDFFGPGDQRERLRRTVEQIPARRAGRPDDIGANAAHLLSDAGDYISGQVLHVNGGWYFGG